MKHFLFGAHLVLILLSTACTSPASGFESQPTPEPPQYLAVSGNVTVKIHGDIDEGIWNQMGWMIVDENRSEAELVPNGPAETCLLYKDKNNPEQLIGMCNSIDVRIPDKGADFIQYKLNDEDWRQVVPVSTSKR